MKIINTGIKLCGKKSSALVLENKLKPEQKNSDRKRLNNVVEKLRNNDQSHSSGEMWYTT
jgi:hypothetical protein